MMEAREKQKKEDQAAKELREKEREENRQQREQEKIRKAEEKVKRELERQKKSRRTGTGEETESGTKGNEGAVRRGNGAKGDMPIPGVVYKS